MHASRKRTRKIPVKGTALLLIDVVSDFDFEDGDELLLQTLKIVNDLARFRRRIKKAGVPVIYANDNFGKWQEDFKTIVHRFAEPSAKGADVVGPLVPDDKDFYVLKPHRSAFYSTSLALLLENLEIKRLMLAGITTDICILFTANDAYMRGFELYIPCDCVAAVTPEYTENTLDFAERVLKADVRPSACLDFKD
jgi:nicotinamidase-related amidase